GPDDCLARVQQCREQRARAHDERKQDVRAQAAAGAHQHERHAAADEAEPGGMVDDREHHQRQAPRPVAVPDKRVVHDANGRSQGSRSRVQVTAASALSEERTLQYLVTDSSTARAAFAAVVPGARMVKCSTAAASRRGVLATRSASTATCSDCTGVRCFCRMVTTSVAAQVASAASSTSTGLGALLASPSTWIFGPPVRCASNSLPPVQSTSIVGCLKRESGMLPNRGGTAADGVENTRSGLHHLTGRRPCLQGGPFPRECHE